MTRLFGPLIILLAGMALAMPTPALACTFDTDCQIGSKCFKPSGSLYGYCVGGLFPGNSNDRKPARNPLDLTGKQGSTCSFDIQCGIGGKCVKSSGSIYGTCL